MEENILIKSQLLKDKFKKWYITWTIIAISFLLLALLINYSSAKSGYSKAISEIKAYADKHYDTETKEYKYAYTEDYLIWHYYDSFEQYLRVYMGGRYASFSSWMSIGKLLGYTNFGLALSIISGAALLTIIITSIIHLILSKCSLIITDKNVKGRALWGKQVVLPIYKISSYSTKKLFSTIAITTTSGVIKFGLIKDYKEIGEVLSTLINQRQENTEVAQATPIIAQQPTSNLDELKKLKELLDMGVISQEEFDAKKKQLLGL